MSRETRHESPARAMSAAVAAARKAGAILREQARAGFGIDRKTSIVNLVTDADRAAEQAIVDHLLASFPTDGVLAEERGQDGRRESGCRWIIDPLDGTTNFAHGFPFYSISIALEREGVCTLGVVLDPIREELFTAEEGQGAWLNGRAIRVSSINTLDDALLTTGFAYDIRETADNNLDHFSRFALRAQGIRRTGSAALDLCYVAAGRLDGYWEVKLSPWDSAAGSVVLKEAGGRITHFNGSPYSIYGKDLVASNGPLHPAMLQVLAERP
ncbi:putative Nus factor SuhB [Nitrospira tepida]|uniref:Inositol-1-monophosphatase n=1 Tax=Nitrospira tepida TaxID=2973512 RepID=A0AA86MVK3_9BACT|nr:inositol monophosphatase family protein [Nitrospira tepida]CAI4029820.1 putative Nus factor SuhB [Nitrospira tepida]